MDIKERLKNLTPEQKALLLKRLSEDRSKEGQSKVALPEIVTNTEEHFEPFPLNNLQVAYLIGRSNAFEMGNIPSVAYVELECKNLDLDRFKKAWYRLINRHEMLRSVVCNNYTQQILTKIPEFEIKINDLREKDAVSKDQELKSIKKSMLHIVKNTEDWPLFEVQVSKISDGLNHVHFILDLLNFDAGSISILFNELKEYYHHSDKELQSLELSYRDYLVAEKKFEATEFYERSKEYWLNRVSTIPPAPDIPLRKNPADVEKPYFTRRIQSINADQWRELKTKTTREGITPTALLLAAYAETLGLWSRTLRFSINIPLFNRLPLHPDVNKIIGDFTTVEILEVDRTEKESFIARAKKIHRQLIADLDHRYFDGVTLLRELSKTNSDDFRKGIPVVFTSLLDHGFTESISQIGKIVDSVNQTAYVWLDLHVDEAEGSLIIKFDAVDELFETSVLDDMLSTYVNLLTKLAEKEENWEDESFYLFPEKQAYRRKIINEINKQVPDELLHSLFAKKVNEQPTALAVISNERNLTFKELYDLSNKIGKRLRKLGAEPNKLVAIVMDKGWEQIPAVYGILQAGSAFLPIDPDFPNERILQLLKDGEVQIVLTQSWIKEKMDWPGNIKCLSIDDDDFTKEDPAPLEPIQKSNDLAYVLYTSGSTGVPKGVMIEHRSVVNRMLDVNERYGIEATDRAIGLTALQHDLSIYDMFGMLMAGGAIVIPERNKRLDPAHWAEVIRDKGVTFWNSVPAFMEMYVDYLEANKDKNVLPKSLRMVVMSGDWIPVSLPDRLRSLVPDVEIIGSGGPTETTVWDIYYPIGQVDPNWKSIPYGKPMTNAKYYIMKDNLEECPDYVIGEICIGGVGLARGFWKDEEKTKEKFTYRPVTGERLYKSGDIGCFLPDGNIQIAGRKDFQVKIRGLRVELSEIETILNGHGEVRDSVVIATGDSQTNKRLIGYVVPNKKFEEPTKEEARQVKESVESEDQSARGGSLLSDIEKMELKLKHLELRQNDDDKKSIDLIKPIVDNKLRDKYLARQTYRKFSEGNGKISLIKFSEFLSCLSQLNIDDLPLPKYRYASAGSLYPVQVYLYVKANKIENVEGGTYYYQPRDHKLILLSPNAQIKKSIHTINNYSIFEESAFSIYLVAQMNAIAPVYGLRAITQRMGSSIFKSLVTAAQMMLFRMRQQSAEDVSRDFCMLEAGYMGQLLMTSAQENQIGLCPVGGVDFEPIRKYFDLEDSHLYLHGFIGGAIDASQNRIFSFLQEISAAAAIKNPRQAFINEVKQYLGRKLPEYMVPANIVILDSLPLTPNGKVDRKALPIPEDGAGADDQGVQSADLSPSADKISQIVGSVLKIEKINPFHNLFNLGATSIQIVMIANLLEKELNFRPKMNEFYRLPSVAGLAESYDKHLQQNQMTEEGEL